MSQDTTLADPRPEGNLPRSTRDRVLHRGQRTLRLSGGTAPGTFAPSAPVRRDQMASFLARLLDAALSPV